ncbi:oligopeptide ABC transporter pemease protein [Streptococcus pneumoniae]|nr:oligopeptide ABC transporter pemease protein [Streptococcus pneumoniae]
MKPMPLWKRNLKKFYNNKLAFIGFICFMLILLACILAPLLTTYSPDVVDLGSMNRPPSAKHILGTDKLGRDVFARILYGGRVSIQVGMYGAICGAVIGTVLGGIAGYFGGKIDALLVRLAELFLTFPNMIVILLLSSIFGQGVFNLIFVFSVMGWMTTFRMVRNEFMSLKQETYVDVCRAFGFSDSRIIFNNRKCFFISDEFSF